MSATLTLTHKTIGVEVHRGTYEVLLSFAVPSLALTLHRE